MRRQEVARVAFFGLALARFRRRGWRHAGRDGGHVDTPRGTSTFAKLAGDFGDYEIARREDGSLLGVRPRRHGPNVSGAR